MYFLHSNQNKRLFVCKLNETKYKFKRDSNDDSDGVFQRSFEIVTDRRSKVK